MPLPLVRLVGLEKDPPFVLLHVTVLPAVLTALLLISASWALIVTVSPAVGLLLLDVTTYFAAGPVCVVMLPLVPVNEVLSVAVTVWTVPATVLVVKTTVATPPVSVRLVGLANDPPVPVLLHVTVLPEVFTELLFASASCARIVTVSPAVGVLLLDVTIYFVAGPGCVVMVGLVPVRPVLSVAVTA